MRAQADSQEGMTLIEVLVALALMALLSVISWRALDITQQSAAGLQARAADSVGIVRALSQIEHDLKHQLGGVDDVKSANLLSLVRAHDDGAWQLVEWQHRGASLVRSTSEPSSSLPMPALSRNEVMLQNILSFTVRVWQGDSGWAVPPVASGSKLAPKAYSSGMGGVEVRIVQNDQGRPVTFRKVVVLP